VAHLARFPSHRSQISSGPRTLPHSPGTRAFDPDLVRPKAIPTGNDTITNYICDILMLWRTEGGATARSSNNTDLQWPHHPDRRIVRPTNAYFLLTSHWSVYQPKDSSTLIRTHKTLAFIKSVNKGLNCAQRWSDYDRTTNSDAGGARIGLADLYSALRHIPSGRPLRPPMSE